MKDLNDLVKYYFKTTEFILNAENEKRIPNLNMDVRIFLISSLNIAQVLNTIFELETRNS